jgi:DNA-directed RNA polymerase subunit RPC12/RpoP
MARLVPRDGFVKETNIKTQAGVARYKADRAGLYSVNDPGHIRALKAEGFVEENLARFSAGDTERGYTCTECGFGSWFRKCSRCGHEYDATPRTDGD